MKTETKILIGAGVAAAAIIGYLLYKKYKGDSKGAFDSSSAVTLPSTSNVQPLIKSDAKTITSFENNFMQKIISEFPQETRNIKSASGNQTTRLAGFDRTLIS